MAMPWMAVCGRGWPDAAAGFLAMWLAMMMAMMAPSLVPMLWRYRTALGRVGGVRLARFVALAGAGYAGIWALLGVAAWLVAGALPAIEMLMPEAARAAPLAAGLVVVIAGAHQFTAWKARHLDCWRAVPGSGGSVAPDAATAWRYGLRLGRHCAASCAGLMLILLVTGIMDRGAMAAVTAAITVERLAPSGWRATQAIGAVVVGGGLFLLAQAAGIGS